MRKYLAITILITALLMTMYGQCSELRDEESKLLKQFNEVKKKLSSPTISLDEYNKLKPEYNKLWKLYSQKKKERLQCEDGKKHQHKKFYNEGMDFKKKKDFVSALKKFEEAIKVKSDFEEAYYQAAIVLIELNKSGSEVDKYIEKVKDKKKKGLLYYKEAKLLDNSNPKKAIAYYEKSGSYYKAARAYYLIGGIYATKLFDSDKAIDSFKKSLRYKKDPKVYEILGATIMDLKPTKTYKSQQIYEDAIKYFELGTKKSKNYKYAARLYVRLAQAYNKRKAVGTTKKALEAAMKSLQLSGRSKNGLAHLEKGKALKKLDKKAEAKKAFEEAQKDNISRKLADFELKQLDK